MFITFEGIDGCGKSTQSRKLATSLRECGRSVVHTREPGGSPGAEAIRELLVTGDPGRWSPKTEILLFSAARRDHLEKTIWPALVDQKIVVCDRFVDSTRVYQGVARADLRDVTDMVHSAIIDFEPDLTLILDLDPSVAAHRSQGALLGEDRFENLGLVFQIELRAGFLALANEFPRRCVVIDAHGTEAEVFDRVWTEVSEWIG